MTFLILAIVSSTINHLLFKAFSRFRIDLLNVIVVNYAVCVIIGYSSSFESVFQNSIFKQVWYPFSILQGVIFVGCLFLLGRTTEKQGVTAAVLSTRLSVAIPTVAAFLLYNDIITTPKTIGILAALFALYLSCGAPMGTSNSSESISGGTPWRAPTIALFVAFGINSTLIKFVQERFLDTVSYHAYVMSAFFAALLFSGSVLVWRLFKRQQVFRWKDLGWGLALGCTNYGAIYFLIRALSVPGRQSSQLFPTISIFVVGLSSLGALSFFKERPCRRMVGALVIGAGSIILINLS